MWPFKGGHLMFSMLNFYHNMPKLRELMLLSKMTRRVAYDVKLGDFEESTDHFPGQGALKFMQLYQNSREGVPTRYRMPEIMSLIPLQLRERPFDLKRRICTQDDIMSDVVADRFKRLRFSSTVNDFDVVSAGHQIPEWNERIPH